MSQLRVNGCSCQKHFCRILTICVCVLSAVALEMSCTDKSHSVFSDDSYVPQKPDYEDPQFWYVERNDMNGQGADIFYLVSTWATDRKTPDGRVSHYADIYNESLRENMNKEISGVAGYMGEGNDFYSPYYRQITIETWATQNEDTINSRFKLSMEDVRKAFSTFLEQRDSDRPFVLAGFSQGGKAVVELLKEMPEELHRYLVAAYVLGYKVTPDDTLVTSNLQAARDSADVGVTICYNSVSDVRYIKPVVSAPCVMCINPVNWRTDATSAVLNDTITVTVFPEHHVLVLNGYSGSEYTPILGFLNVGDFHGCEPWLYQECLRRNVQLRIREYYSRMDSLL